MSIFGIKKNEYGGGTLTPVEGGGGITTLYVCRSDDNVYYVSSECDASSDMGTWESRITKGELKNICEKGMVALYGNKSWSYPFMINCQDGFEYGDVVCMTPETPIILYTKEYTTGPV